MRRLSLPPLLPLSLLAALTLSVGACQPEPPPAPVAGARVESDGLGIALASVPPPFEVVANAADRLELAAPGTGGDGRAVFATGPVESGGINLVEKVKAKKAEFEGMAGARYFGNRELGSPIGTAFTARAAYPGPDGEVEETWVFAIHPGENRLLTLTFTYPPGESEERVGQLLSLFGEVEALPAGPE